MREQIEREPFHVGRIVMVFQSTTHIQDVAFETVTIAALTLREVVVWYDGLKFTVTPHLDVPDVIETYRALQAKWHATNPDGPHVGGKNEGPLMNLTIKDGKVTSVRPA